MNPAAYSATIGRRTHLIVAAAVLAAVAAWAGWHAYTLHQSATGNGSPFAVLFAATFVFLAVQLVASYLERPARPQTRRQADAVRSLRVVVPVPVFDEDPAAVRLGLESILSQSHRVKRVHVVDDGSSIDYQSVISWLSVAAPAYGVEWRWERQENAGKRVAQARVFRSSPDADVFGTTDSDTLWAPDAVEQARAPFADRRVMSVAGVVLALNNRANLLARITDLYFVTSQLVARSALSAFGAVLVNSGPIAFYRADVIRANVDEYVNETFAGRPVKFSDDSMLTLYAKTATPDARTVQQPSAFSFSLMPVTFSHHWRQYLRWMRGSTIRSVWRFRFLPVRSVAYWAHLWTWLQMVLASTVIVVLALSGTFTRPEQWALLATVPLVVGYVQGLRYLTIRRSDETRAQAFVTWLLMPLAVVWAMTVLRVCRWYGMATCWKTGEWGTRGNGVEVGLSSATGRAA